MNRNHVLFLIVLLSAPGILLPLRAQVVNDGATRTLSNETNTIPGDVTVGTNGSFTLLIFSNNALLTNSVNGLIGRNATAKSNEVRLISPTAGWRMGGTLFVGSNGAMSRLVVSRRLQQRQRQRGAGDWTRFALDEEFPRPPAN